MAISHDIPHSPLSLTGELNSLASYANHGWGMTVSSAGKLSEFSNSEFTEEVPKSALLLFNIIIGMPFRKNHHWLAVLTSIAHCETKHLWVKLLHTNIPILGGEAMFIHMLVFVLIDSQSAEALIGQAKNALLLRVLRILLSQLENTTN